MDNYLRVFSAFVYYGLIVYNRPKNTYIHTRTLVCMYTYTYACMQIGNDGKRPTIEEETCKWQNTVITLISEATTSYQTYHKSEPPSECLRYARNFVTNSMQTYRCVYNCQYSLGKGNHLIKLWIIQFLTSTILSGVTEEPKFINVVKISINTTSACDPWHRKTDVMSYTKSDGLWGVMRKFLTTTQHFDEKWQTVRGNEKVFGQLRNFPKHI